MQPRLEYCSFSAHRGLKAGTVVAKLTVHDNSELTQHGVTAITYVLGVAGKTTFAFLCNQYSPGAGHGGQSQQHQIHTSRSAASGRASALVLVRSKLRALQTVRCFLQMACQLNELPVLEMHGACRGTICCTCTAKIL